MMSYLHQNQRKEIIKFEFETGNKEEAFQLWKNLVKQKGVGYRYFEYDDPKYKEFYNTRK